jgi:hypothetical protein
MLPGTIPFSDGLEDGTFVSDRHNKKTMLILFIPLLGSFLLHAPILRFDLFRQLRVPLDLGARWRGRRLLGDNKTFRGALAMFSGTLAMACVLRAYSPFWNRLPAAIQAAGPVIYGSLLGLGMVVGELPNSFLKRQLDILPGTQRKSFAGVLISLFDQADFVPAIYITLLPIFRIPLPGLALAFVGVAAIHLLINLIGYAIGARKNLL